MQLNAFKAVATLIMASAVGQSALGQNTATPQSSTEPRIAFVKVDINELDAAVTAYEHAFQMRDIGRMHGDAPPEDVATLKFGESTDAARASTTVGIILVSVPGRKALHGAPNKTPYLVLTVPNVQTTLGRATAAGFKVVIAPRPMGGYSEAWVADASGNVIELIQLP
jgi:predicted enzyme related to lactoylglutathione lyase